MGMPITTYNVLGALVDGGKYEIQIARDVLDSFSVFAFIIHDPDADKHSAFGWRNRDFDKTINTNFDYLDHLTGGSLLFFALVDPPEKWLSHADSRPYYKHLLDRENAITSNDRSITAFSLAKSLKIPYEELPCLVVTPRFSEKQVVWVRTCADQVRNQLSWLGYRAEQSRRIGAVESFFNDVRNEINLCEGSGLTVLESSLAEALTDVMSFIIEADRTWSNSCSRDRVQNTLAQLNETLRNLKGSKALNNEELENLCAKIVSFEAHLNSQANLNLNDFIDIDKTLLEVESQLILTTAHMVTDLFKQSNRGMIDYTAPIICLAKIFEREMNLSVIHWIRESLGITLPDYFNKFQPEIEAIYRKTGRHIDFNILREGTQDEWLPPGLGVSWHVYQQLAKNRDGIRNWVPENIEKDFLRDWHTIQVTRNRAAHTEFMNEQNSTNVKDALNRLSQNRVFHIFSCMKSRAMSSTFR